MIETVAAQIDPSAPWDSKHAAEYDRKTLDSWLADNTNDPMTLKLYRIIVPALSSAEPPEMSLLHFLFYVKSGTSLETLISTTGGAQERRVVGGTHLISERMARDLGEAVRLRSAVRRVAHDADGVTVTYDLGEISADHAVIALPPTLAGRLVYDPSLPSNRDSLT